MAVLEATWGATMGTDPGEGAGDHVVSPTTGPVAALINRGWEAIYNAADDVSRGLTQPAQLAAVRLALIAVSRASKRSEVVRSFTALESEWNRSQDRYSADSAAVKSANTAFASRFKDERHPLKFSAKTIPDFVLAINAVKDDPVTVGAMAILAAWKAETSKARNRLLVSAIELFDFESAVSSYLENGSLELFESAGPAAAAIKSAPAASSRGSELAMSVAALFDPDASNPKLLARLFFDQKMSAAGALNDTRFYALYRCSTQHPEVVRAIVAIHGSKTDDDSQFSFDYAYNAYRSKRSRFAKGVVACIMDSIYLVAPTYEVTKGAAPGRKVLSDILLVAARKGAIETDGDFITGVYASSGLSHQPIVGRCALVHLGFGSDLGEDVVKQLAPAIVTRRTEARRSVLADDLAKVLTAAGAPAAGDVDELANQVFDAINNLPVSWKDKTELPEVLAALAPEDFRSGKPEK